MKKPKPRTKLETRRQRPSAKARGTPLDKLAEQLRADLADLACTKRMSLKQWVEGERLRGEHLQEARKRFRSDKAFAAWLAREEINIDEIAELIGMSKYIARLRRARL
jgi:hypothetical protein